MKKTFILLAVSFVAFPLFAYHDYSYCEDSGISQFIYLLLFIWGILNIILFFKIWGATNDIKFLRNRFCVEDSSNYVDRERLLDLYLKGEDDKAYNYLNEKMIKAIYQIFKEIEFVKNRNEKFDERLTKTINTYSPLYKAFDREIPERIKNVTYESICKFGKPEKTESERS